jgi:hypothetical protein
MTRPHGDGEAPLQPAAMGALLPLLSGYAWSWVVYLAAELELADHLAEEPRSAEELAELCAADPGALRRLLEALAALGVVRRLEDGRFARTPVSDWLRRDVAGSQRPLALMLGDPRIQRAWAASLVALRSGEVAFEHINGPPFFEVLDQAPDLAGLFHAAGSGTETWNRDMARALDLSECKRVVDVGGGDGSLMTAITAMHPHVEGVVLERPPLVEAMSARPSAGAWRWQAGDFLDEVVQPARTRTSCAACCTTGTTSGQGASSPTSGAPCPRMGASSSSSSSCAPRRARPRRSSTSRSSS